MKTKKRIKRTIALPAIAGALFLAFPVLAQSVLSPAQEKVVGQKTAKLSKSERDMIAGWSDSKKLAEFFCSPAGLRELKKADQKADRVFLGPDDEGVKKFALEGNTRLSGRGSVRVVGAWKDFSFQCTLDPEKATTTSFTYKFDTK
jgi:hypothetical protein